MGRSVTVFTNGCFDVFHYGHLYILKEARKLGEALIVGINSDESVKRLKGRSRPIFPYEYRSQVVASLIYVDGVIKFEEDTPLELIKRVRPDVLVKGGDWEGNIVGSDFVKAIGGRVVSIPLVKGISTTGILNGNKIQT
jgi:D-beta-D-heptose 7-phosphate kinase/D-beta-D-heptose 1-phosphate adenosyltransferase